MLVQEMPNVTFYYKQFKNYIIKSDFKKRHIDNFFLICFTENHPYVLDDI